MSAGNWQTTHKCTGMDRGGHDGPPPVKASPRPAPLRAAAKRGVQAIELPAEQQPAMTGSGSGGACGCTASCGCSTGLEQGPRATGFTRKACGRKAQLHSPLLANERRALVRKKRFAAPKGLWGPGGLAPHRGLFAKGGFDARGCELALELIGAAKPGAAARPATRTAPWERWGGGPKWEAKEAARLEGWVEGSGYTATAPPGAQLWVEEVEPAEQAAAEADAEFASLVACEGCSRTWGGAAQCPCGEY